MSTRCTNGHENPDEGGFCGECGVPLADPTTENAVTGSAATSAIQSLGTDSAAPSPSEQGWHADPTCGHELRYSDGERWTDHVSDHGQQTTDPFTTADEPTALIGSQVPARPNRTDRDRSRRWPWIVALVGVLVVGLGLGAVSRSSTVDDLKAKLARVQDERDTAVAKVDSREARRRADLAKAAAARASLAKAEQQKKDDADKVAKAAADKAAADAAAVQKANADAFAAAAANAAKMSTIDSDGVYAIGTDKNPGRYHTDGTGSCYYAILNSPDTFDIATNDNVTGPTYADLPAGKFFETKDCGTWTKV